MRRMYRIGLTLGIVVALSSCAMTGGSGSDADAAMAAGGLLDYLASQGYEQVQELETAVVSFDLGGAAGAESRAVTEDTEVLEYANVTVTVTRSLDDKDTATPTDDVLTITRIRDYGFEADYIEVLVRPLKPTADAAWNSFDNGTGANGWSEPVFSRIDQSGTVERSLDAVKYADGTVDATWALVPANSAVYAETIVKEMTDVVRPDLVRRTIISQTESGDVTMTREREIDGTVVERYTAGTWIDPDTSTEYPMIVREDGSYAVIIARGDRNGAPRIVRYYSDDDTLVADVAETRSATNGAMVSVRTSYDETGAVTGQHTVSYSINYRRGDEDSVSITRIAGGRQRTVTITESGEVYLVTVRGQAYRVRVSDRRTVEFLDTGGSVYMTAGQNPDGSWTITSGGESRTL